MDKIIPNIRTTMEAKKVLSALEDLSSTLFITKERTQDKPDYFSHLQPELANILNETFCKNPIDEENREKIKLQISEMRKAIEACKTVQMTMAFQPDDQALSDLSSWIKTHAGKEFLIDVQIDKTLIAGALITANGLHKDYSLQKKLSDAFRIKREQIMGVLIS